MSSGPKIHPEAINQLAKAFNTHKKGLPEWLKNAREAYLRAGVAARSDRNVVVHYWTKGEQYLEVIDFVGISGDQIDSRYMVWSDPDAASHGLKPGEAEGGQGNGGKSYLRQLFERGYFISTCGGKLSVVSFIDLKKYELAFVPDEATGKDYAGDNSVLPGIRDYAGDWLEVCGLPRDHDITIVRGVVPKKPIEPETLLTQIQQFPQARETIKSCRVTYWEDAVERFDLKVDEPTLHPAFKDPIEIPIPEILHRFGIPIKTALPPDYPKGALEIRIASRPLAGQALGTWNRIDLHAFGPTVIAYAQIDSLPLKLSQYGKYVYGSCRVPMLKHPSDDYETQARTHLNTGPLRDVLYDFIAEEIDKRLESLAKQAQSQSAMKKRKNLQKLNEKLAAWMESKFPNITGMQDEGDGSGKGRKKRGPRTPKTHKPAVKLKAHRSSLDLCVDVTYPMRAVAYDEDDLPVPPGKLVWRSSDAATASINPDTGHVLGKKSGMATLNVENDIGLKSGSVLVNVHEATQIKITNHAPVKVGSNRRVLLNVQVINGKGHTVKDPAVCWRSSATDVATVGPDGWLVGGEEGDAEVTAYVGCLESVPLEVDVEKGSAGEPKGGGKGKPQILLSGQDQCPFEKTEVFFDAADPIVLQRPGKLDYEHNVFWINLQHPMAEALLKGGEQTVQWRTYHFQRVIDVYAMLLLRREYGDEKFDVDVVLDAVQQKVTEIFAWAKEDTEIFNVLYAEDLDLATLS